MKVCVKGTAPLDGDKSQVQGLAMGFLSLSECIPASGQNSVLGWSSASSKQTRVYLALMSSIPHGSFPLSVLYPYLSGYFGDPAKFEEIMPRALAFTFVPLHPVIDA